MTCDTAVTVSGDEPNGLATMLADLLDANLARHPERRALLRDAVVVLTAADAGVQATISMRRGAVDVRAGGAGDADLVVSASSTELLELASAPLRFGLPDVLSSRGRSVVASLLRGRIRIRPPIRRVGLLARLARLLSVA